MTSPRCFRYRTGCQTIRGILCRGKHLDHSSHRALTISSPHTLHENITQCERVLFCLFLPRLDAFLFYLYFYFPFVLIAHTVLYFYHLPRLFSSPPHHIIFPLWSTVFITLHHYNPTSPQLNTHYLTSPKTMHHITTTHTIPYLHSATQSITTPHTIHYHYHYSQHHINILSTS